MLRLTLILCALSSCHAHLPEVSGCVPYTHRCAGDRVEVCSASHRWEPEGDQPCAAIGQVCRDGACVDAIDAGTSHDGGGE